MIKYFYILIYLFICTIIIWGQNIQKERKLLHYGITREKKLSLLEWYTDQIDNNSINNNPLLFLSTFGHHQDNNIDRICKVWEGVKQNQCCIFLPYPLFDEEGHEILPASISWQDGYWFEISPLNDIKAVPSVPICPPTLGKLLWYAYKFKCECTSNGLFGGKNCDQPMSKLTQDNGCRKVGWIHDLNLTDISKFHPVKEGVCVECSISETIPNIEGIEPSCIHIHLNTNTPNSFSSASASTSSNSSFYKSNIPLDTKAPCIYDALNPRNRNELNTYVEGYGCSCDYYSGYVEVLIPVLATLFREENLVSNACVKIGHNTKDPHRADLAYYTLENKGKPLQTHTYYQLESIFQPLMTKSRARLNGDVEFIIDQPTLKKVHAYDWMNRHIKANPHQILLRLRYDDRGDDWPIVHKTNFINHYRRRSETYPLLAYKLAVGAGYEDKHYYEYTDDRRLSNAIWGHPIVFSIYSDSIWHELTTLNPLGVMEGWYFGLTMFTQPGYKVRLDTRGEFRNPGEVVPNVIPPDYHELIDPRDSISHPAILYISYVVNS
ncbi:hypothetical protein TCON_2073 [Astathelohania contejeani]|uniref:Uncharacterized protein n=1 Tax=Astathelohania contejeani TaxID=164912 RepID=A0ABQ7HX39_9MICR|nr:hypothetical protein TCON_2073 [Thelohania contejeani]